MPTHHSRARAAAARLRARLSGRGDAAPSTGTRSVADTAIIESGLVDLEWYSFETGRTFTSVADAVRHFRTQGNRLGMSLNPLFVKNSITDVPAGLTSFDALLADPELQHDYPPFQSLSVRFHTWLDDESREHPFGPWGALASDLTPDTELWMDRLSRHDAVPWRELEPVWRDLVTRWNAGRAVAPVGARAKAPAPLDLTKIPAIAEDRQPLVTVIAVAHEADTPGLRAAVESVRAQTWSAWELVIVDDGTTTDSQAVWSALAARDARIRVEAGPVGSPGELLNRGLAAARGDYVAFIDADHRWTPDHLDLVVRTMVAGDLTAAFSVLKVSTNDRVRYRVAEVTPGSLVHQDRVDLTTLVVATEAARAVDGFDTSLPHAVGYDFTLRLDGRGPLVGVSAATVHRDERSDDEDEDEDEDEEPTGPTPTWTDVVRARHLVPWQQLADTESTPGLVSIVLSMRSSTRFVLWQIRAIWIAYRDTDVPWEVVVVDHSAGRAVIAMLAPLIAEGLPIRYLRLPSRTSYALAMDVGLTRASGEFVVLVDDDIRIDPVGLADLTATLAATDRPAVLQPVIVDHHQVIVSAGAVFGPRHDVPAALLGGHLYGDAEVLGSEPFEVDSVDSRVIALRRTDLISLRGLDPLFDRELDAADLGLRLRAAHDDALVAVLPTSRMFRRLKGRVPENGIRTRREFAARHTATTAATDSALWENWNAHVVGWERLTKHSHAIRPVLAGTGGLRWLWVEYRASVDPSVRVWLRSIRAALTELGDHCSVHSGPTAIHPRDDLLDVVVAVGAAVLLPETGQYTTVRWYDETSAERPEVHGDLHQVARTTPCSTLTSPDPQTDATGSPSAGRVVVLGDRKRWGLFSKALEGRRLLTVGEVWRPIWVDEDDLDDDDRRERELIDWIPTPSTSQDWAALLLSADDVIVVHDRAAEIDGAISAAAVDALILRGDVLSNIEVKDSWGAGVRSFTTRAGLASQLAATATPLTQDDRHRLWEQTSPMRRAIELRSAVLAHRAETGGTA